MMAPVSIDAAWFAANPDRRFRQRYATAAEVSQVVTPSAGMRACVIVRRADLCRTCIEIDDGWLTDLGDFDYSELFDDPAHLLPPFAGEAA